MMDYLHQKLRKSETDYLWNFILYTGATTEYPEPVGVNLPKDYDE